MTWDIVLTTSYCSCQKGSVLYHTFTAMKTEISIKEQVLSKMKQYCSYQERCNAEVKNRLCSFGLNNNEAEEIVLHLKEGNYLDNERFAIQFARGKFRIKQWGRVKIKYGLKQKQIDDHLIKKALKQIGENDYRKTLNKLAEQKFKALEREKTIFNKKKKLLDYLVQKGYERRLAKEMVDKKVA